MLGIMLAIAALLMIWAARAIYYDLVVYNAPGHSDVGEVEFISFLTYKDAVQNYVEDNPGFTGTISLNALNLPQTGGFVPAFSNYEYNVPASVSNNASQSGTEVISWYLPTGYLNYNIYQTNNNLDATIGIYQNGVATMYRTGTQINLSGLGIPNNAIVSVDVQYGNGT